ncbi:MAG: hypothetical protein AB7J46_07920, partial [Candidatus Altimarinota bacterium]
MSKNQATKAGVSVGHSSKIRRERMARAVRGLVSEPRTFIGLAQQAGEPILVHAVEQKVVGFPASVSSTNEMVRLFVESTSQNVEGRLVENGGVAPFQWTGLSLGFNQSETNTLAHSPPAINSLVPSDVETDYT